MSSGWCLPCLSCSDASGTTIISAFRIRCLSELYSGYLATPCHTRRVFLDFTHSRSHDLIFRLIAGTVYTLSMQPAPIEQLPPPTRHLLRSTQILTSLCQIVSELVQNSLDAGAHNIQVGIDCEEWTCWVRDDGSGMTKEDMKVIGTDSEDRRYGKGSNSELYYKAHSFSFLGSSKAYSPDSLNALSTFGFRGEGTSLMVLVSSFSAYMDRSSGFCCRYLLSGDLITHGEFSRKLVGDPQGVATFRL